MAATLILAYDIWDPETYIRYNPGSLETVAKTVARHGGKFISAGTHAKWLEGSAREVTLVLRFPTVDAANAFLKDPDYRAVSRLRESSTENTIAFVAPDLPPPR